MKIPILLLLATGGLLAGCDKRVSVGTGYELVRPQTYLIDSGSPACALYYQDKQVWPNVLIDTKTSYRDGYYVFLASVPDTMGTRYDYTITPQLYAIRGAGPPVILSQRLFNQPLAGLGDRSLASLNNESLTNLETCYTVDNITSEPNGFKLTFKCETGDALDNTQLDISWPEIESWVQEAETSAPVRVTTLGSYRLLPTKH